MCRKILQALFVSFLVSLTVNSQTQENTQLDYEKAKEIIKQSQQAIYQKQKRENIKSIYLKTNGTSAIESTIQTSEKSEPTSSKLRHTIEEEVSFGSSDKINNTIFSYNADKNPTENYTKVESVLNGEKFFSNTDTIMDGKRFDMSDILNSNFLPESEKKKIKESLEKAKKAVTKESIQKSTSGRLFPILLDMNWMNDKTFVYIGKAEAGDTKADILEVETNTGRQTRYFFDEKTHLLLMMTDEISKDGVSSKITTYFADYQLFDGLLVAKKVNIESESLMENREIEIMGQKMKVSSKSKMVSETIIKEFKINPTFKPETFAVKEEK